MSDRERRPGFREETSTFRRREAARNPHRREVQSSEAKTHLPQLLDEVERGATIVITRHGRAIARLVPEAEGHQDRIAAAIDEMKKLAKERAERFGRVTVKDILEWRHEGHKY